VRCIQRRLAAPGGAAIDEVVVDQGGLMDQLDCRGHPDLVSAGTARSCARGSGGPVREREDRRPQPLSGLEEAAIERGRGFDRAQHELHLAELVADQRM
jgi:hypothetical protein